MGILQKLVMDAIHHQAHHQAVHLGHMLNHKLNEKARLEEAKRQREQAEKLAKEEAAKKQQQLLDAQRKETARQLAESQKKMERNQKIIKAVTYSAPIVLPIADSAIRGLFGIIRRK